MPTLNLQTILNGEDIGTMISKINENFAQLSSNGGGPQGSRGIQGPPGLPGLRGEQGNAGDNGLAGQQVTLIGDDPNWGILYSGTPGSPSDATSAISEGYNVGDVWIDNNAGIFYVITEPSAGVYEFQPHPLSPSVTSAGNFWIPDSSYSTNTNTQDSLDQGLLMANRLATLSLTSYKSIASGSLVGDAALANDIIGTYEQSYIAGFRRPSYKLSIDQVIPKFGGTAGDNYIGRVDGDNDSGSVHDSYLLEEVIDSEFLFGVKYGNYSPLLYLNTSNGAATTGLTQNTAFGILHSVKEDEQGKYSTLLISGSKDISGGTILALDMPYVSTSAQHLIFNNNSNDTANTHVIGVGDINPDGTVNDGNNRSLWLSLTSQESGNQQPFVGNETFNTMGIRLRAKTDGSGEIDFYTHSDIYDGTPANKELELETNNLATTNDLHMKIRPTNAWITKSLTVGQSFGNLSTSPAITNGAMIQGHLTVGRVSGSTTGQPFPLTTFPYSFKTTYPGIATDATPFTIEQSGKKFVFRNSNGSDQYTMFFTIDEESASIRTNVQTRSLTFGVEWWNEPTYFKGNDLIIQPNGNVGLGYNPQVDVNDANTKFNNRFVITAHGTDSSYRQAEDNAGIQMTNPDIGYDKNAGGIIRMDDNLTVLKIANATSSNSNGISFYPTKVDDTSNTIGRAMSIQNTGQVTFGGKKDSTTPEPNDLNWLAPGVSTLSVGGTQTSSSSNTRDAIYMGNMGRKRIENLEWSQGLNTGSHPWGSAWLGFNAWVADVDNPSGTPSIKYGDKVGADNYGTERSAGVIQFMDQEGKFHIAARQRGTSREVLKKDEEVKKAELDKELTALAEDYKERDIDLDQRRLTEEATKYLEAVNAAQNTQFKASAS